MSITDNNIILQAEVGSTAWGLNLEDKGDRDEMGICLEGLPQAIGFNPFEQLVYRSAAEREHKHDAPSSPGDLDLTVYGLRKWMRLALKGNPTILTLLFVPQSLWVKGNAVGSHLQELAPRIVSKAAGKAFLGYLQAQRQRMLGERGGLDIHRKELEERYGYDSKYAMHMLRLGYQGVELLSEGKLSMPMNEAIRNDLLRVRKGEGWTRQDVLTRCGELEAELKDLLDSSPLPPTPESDFCEKWVIQTYWDYWCGLYGNPVNSLRHQLEASLKG